MTNCMNLEIVGGGFIVTRPLCDGTYHARIALEGKESAVVALHRGPTPTGQLPSKKVSVQRITVDLKAIPVHTKVLELIGAPVNEVDITKADILVSIGRGIEDNEGELNWFSRHVSWELMDCYLFGGKDHSQNTDDDRMNCQICFFCNGDKHDFNPKQE